MENEAECKKVKGVADTVAGTADDIDELTRSTIVDANDVSSSVL